MVDQTFESEVKLIATQAIKTFQVLDRAADKFTASVNKQATAVTGFNKITKDGFGGVKKATVQLNRATLAHQAFNAALRQNALGQFPQRLKNSQTQLQGLTTQYDSFVRLVTSQIVSRGIAALAGAFREATTSARELEITVARIQTIDASFRARSGQSIATQLIGTAAEFGRPIEELATGLYDTLSNQVGEGEVAVAAFTEALRLQTIVGGTTADSVDLLSSVLNAFNIDARQSAIVTDKLFATIDLGRVTTADLGNRFGRVATQASQLGVSLDETLGTVAAATTVGIKASEAITQLGQEIVSLTKPSKAMAAALLEAGITSVELAVASTSLDEVLAKVRATTDGTQESLAKLFPNIRANRLEQTRANDTGGDFAATIGSIGQRTGETADEMERLIRKTTGFKLNQAFEAFNAQLSANAGVAFNEQLFSIITQLGGAQQAASVTAEALKALIVPTLIAGVLGFTLVLNKARTGLIGLAGGITTARGRLLGFASAIAAGILILRQSVIAYAEVNSEVKKLQRTLALRAKEGELQAKIIQRNAAKEATARIESTNRQIAAIASLLDVTRAGLDERASNARLLEANITENLIDQVNKRVNILEGFAKNAARIEERSTKVLQSLQNKRFSTELQASGAAFNRSLVGKDDKASERLIAARVDKLLTSAKRALELGQFDIAEQLLGQSGALAERSANITRSEVLTNRVLQGRLGLNDALVAQEQQKVAEAKAAAKIAAQQALKVRDRITLLKEEIATLSKLRKEGIGGSAFDAQSKRVLALAAELDETFIESGASLANILSVPDFVAKAKQLSQPFEDAFTAEPITLKFGLEDLAAQLKATIENVFVDLKIPTGARPQVADILGLDAQTASVKEFETSLLSLQNELKRTTNAASVARAASQSDLGGTNFALVIKSSTAILRQALKDAEEGFLVEGKLPKTGITPSTAASIVAQYKDIFFQLEEAAKSENFALFDQIAQKFSAGIGQAFVNIDQSDFTTAVQGFTDFATLSTTIDEAITGLRASTEKGIAANKFEAEAEAVRAKLEQLKQLVPGFNASFEAIRVQTFNAAFGLDAVKTSVSGLGTSFSTQAPGIGAATTALQQNTAAQQANNAARAAGAGAGLSNGRAANGRIGTDSRSVLTDPGEAIINRAASSRFAGTLKAMNSGFGPSRFANGGVTNVGDVHINVSGTETSPVSARTLVKEVRRELRRNTSRLN